MTTNPVVSITAELLAEIERDFSSLTCPIEFGKETIRKASGVCLMATELRRLRAEVQALKKDSDRLEWWFIKARNATPDAVDVTLDQWRNTIDTAMQSTTEGN